MSVRLPRSGSTGNDVGDLITTSNNTGKIYGGNFNNGSSGADRNDDITSN